MVLSDVTDISNNHIEDGSIVLQQEGVASLRNNDIRGRLMVKMDASSTLIDGGEKIDRFAIC